MGSIENCAKKKKSYRLCGALLYNDIIDMGLLKGESCFIS